jgi:uncharacterized repeat protein (TIGR01451 family)
LFRSDNITAINYSSRFITNLYSIKHNPKKNTMNRYLQIALLVVLAFPMPATSQTIDWFGQTSQPEQPELYIQSWARSLAVNEVGEVFTLGLLYNQFDENASANYSYGNGIEVPFSLMSSENGGFLMKQSASGEVIWVKKWVGLPSMETVKITSSGDIIIGGIFQSTADFDPNQGIYEIVHLNETVPASFVMKLSAEGEFQWATDFQGETGNGNNMVEFTSLALDSNDGILVAGNFQGAVTIGEPVVSSSAITSTGYGKAGFVAKFTSNGDFLWVRQIDGANQYYDMRVNGVSSDASGNVYLTGGFKGYVRFNGGESNGLAGSFGSVLQNTPMQSPKHDIFTATYNSSGDFIWMRGLSNTQEDTEGYDIAIDDQGNVYSTGYFRGLTQFQGSVHTVGNNDDTNPSESIYLCKQAPDGNVEWVREFGSGIGWSVELDASGNPCFSGHFEETADFDPNLGSNLLISEGMSDAFVSRLDNFGNLIWAARFGNESQDLAYGIAVNNYTVYAAGQASPDDGQGGYVTSMFNMKFNPDNECLAFNAIISDIQEVAFASSGSVEVTAYGGMEPYNYVWNTTPTQTGQIATAPDPGLYAVTVTDEVGCSRTTGAILSGPAVLELGEIELQVNLGATSFSNICNSTGVLWLDAFNAGGQSIDATLTLDLGPYLSYESAIPPASSVSGNVVSWDIDAMNFASGHFAPRIVLSTPSSIIPGTVSCFNFSISPTEGDVAPTNNYREFCIPLLCSFDPNDKMVYPQGDGEFGNVTNNQTMTYTIRFQNTGTAPAVNVFILDTIHPNLDITSLRVVGQSHPMVTEWNPGNEIRFRFDNIMLPDSVNNEPESHGYVIYEIDQMPDLNSGEQMLNTANIYFDFNEPVQTNTVVNTIAWPVSAEDTQLSRIIIRAYPVPASDWVRIVSDEFIEEIKVIDALGRIIFRERLETKTTELNCSNWPTGIYFLDATTAQGRSYLKISIK